MVYPTDLIEPLFNSALVKYFLLGILDVVNHLCKEYRTCLTVPGSFSHRPTLTSDRIGVNNIRTSS
jgi:hypothetical protein